MIDVVTDRTQFSKNGPLALMAITALAVSAPLMTPHMTFAATCYMALVFGYRFRKLTLKCTEY